ncbi:MAG: DUF1015 family protein [Actinomycetota bacterium]
MPRVFPFEAFVYDVAVVGALDRVTTPPYDVISEARRQEYRSEPFSIVQIDLGAGDGAGRYVHAGALLRRWVDEGVLVRTPPAFHAYEMRSSATERVRGVLCAMELEEWGGNVMPHEETMAGPVEDRLRLLRATHTHLSAVYGTVAGPCPSLEDLLDAVTARPPEAELMDEQGVNHRRWTIPADVPIGDRLAEEPLLIADGHHRYTTALAYRDEMRAGLGPGPWDRLLTFVVDAGSERLSVRPFHRIQLSGTAPDAGRPVGDLDAVLGALSDDEPRIGVVLPNGAHAGLTVRDLAGEPPAVRALHDGFLDALAPPGALRFTPHPGEAVAAVESREAVAAYLLPPTTPDRIRKVVERGERLPQKSTYFWPKPRTGMILMPLDDRSDP